MAHMVHIEIVKVPKISGALGKAMQSLEGLRVEAEKNEKRKTFSVPVLLLLTELEKTNPEAHKILKAEGRLPMHLTFARENCREVQG